MPFATGTNVGRYRIMEQLGQGGMATVYKAYHAELDRYVALKVLHQAFLEDANFQARFQREARLVAKLEHPNIVPVYDFDQHEGQPYLVMKFIEGQTLKARMARGPLSTPELTQIIDAVGAGLAYAHKQGILHRDIKPSNVILANDGGVYLADFGLARIAQSGESTLSSDMIMGTPQYISPEQAMGKRELDEGTDIYSFGVMLYEMVVGQVPFSADTPFSVIHDHIYSPLPLPRSVNPTVPEAVERVLLKALSKERGDRYANVTTMLTAFRQAWEQAGVPMQGASVTLPRMPAAETEAAARKTASPVDGGGAASAPPPVTAGPEDATPSPVPPAEGTSAPPAEVAPSPGKPKRRINRWVWIAALVLLGMCCILVFLATRNQRQNQAGLNLQATQAAEVGPSSDVPTPGEVISPAVEEARQRAEQNPGDPYARLDLAIAYFDADQPRLFQEQLRKAAELAGEDQQFFIDAGQKLAERQAWSGAAAMYLRAVELAGDRVPPDLQAHLNEAVYRAAMNPEFEQFIPFESIGAVDQALMLAAQARFNFYNVDRAAGEDYLQQLKRLKPDYALARLLEAEFAFKNGDANRARALLNDLLADLGAAQWIRDEANHLLQSRQ